MLHTIGVARRGRDSRDSRDSREIEGRSGSTGWCGMVRHGVVEIKFIRLPVVCSGFPSSGSLLPGCGSERQRNIAYFNLVRKQ